MTTIKNLIWAAWQLTKLAFHLTLFAVSALSAVLIAASIAIPTVVWLAGLPVRAIVAYRRNDRMSRLESKIDGLTAGAAPEREVIDAAA